MLSATAQRQVNKTKERFKVDGGPQRLVAKYANAAEEGSLVNR